MNVSYLPQSSEEEEDSDDKSEDLESLEESEDEVGCTKQHSQSVCQDHKNVCFSYTQSMVQ